MVDFKVEEVGRFYKKADKTAIPGVAPPLLNNNPSRYGSLEEMNLLNLKLGCENFEDTACDEKFEALSDYLMKTFKKGASLKESLNADFFSNRGNFLTIATSMYSRRGESSTIQAVRHKGVIFLNNWKEKTLRLADGYKFNLYMTLDKDGEQFDDITPADNSESTRVVFRSTVESVYESISLFYATDIDATYSDGSFVELKTIKHGFEAWLVRSLGHYMQALFAKTSCIVYGEKNPDQTGCVDRVYKKLVGKIPEECAKYPKECPWNKDVCMHQLFSTLQKIKSELRNDGDALLLTVHNGSIEMQREEEPMQCDLFSEEFFNHFC